MTETNDLPFTAYVATYHSLQPYRVTTDISGTATFHFKVSEEIFQSWKKEYAEDAGITQFVANVRRLQSLAEQADKRGGILTL